MSTLTQIEFHRYALKPRSLLIRGRAGEREGALLRLKFSDLDVPGVADLFPWRIYGDPTLGEWLERLREISKSGFSQLAESKIETDCILFRAIEAARDEAMAVASSRPLVGGSIVNHALSTDPLDLASGDIVAARRATFPAIKIKIGHADPRAEAEALGRLLSHWGPLRLRLDANERMTREGLLVFLETLPILIRDRIEFIEDPFAFDIQSWSRFHRETGIAIACDLNSQRDKGVEPLREIFNEGAAQVLVHKPAWQDQARAHFARDHDIPLVVTSILGHPVGNLWAASKAFELAPTGVHGCMSHTAYRDDEASAALVKSKQARGSRIVGQGIGLGLGFGPQAKWWNRIRWESLT